MTSIDPPVRTHMTSLAPVWSSWQSHVPSVLTSCEQRWGLEVVERIAFRVTSSLFRVRVRGRDAVLKLALPGPHLTQQGNLLAQAAGNGYVHLYDRDDDRGALLLESLGPSLETRGEAMYSGLPVNLIVPLLHDSELVPPLVETLKVAWQVPLDRVPVPDDEAYKATQLRDLIDSLADSLGVRDEHFDALARARLYAEQRLTVRGTSQLVVCHGDPHPGNLLAIPSPRPGASTGYVWVDPDGFMCEPEYDLGVVLRGFNRLILAAEDPVVTLRSWCAVLADATDTDAEAIWQWAFIERVSSGLYLMSQGWPERGRQFLESASWLIARKGPSGPAPC